MKKPRVNEAFDFCFLIILLQELHSQQRVLLDGRVSAGPGDAFHDVHGQQLPDGP
jgi:hypothetical protein